jgi:hypothetical protein
MMMMTLGTCHRLLCLLGSSSVAPAAPPAIDPTLAVILQFLTQQQAPLAAEQARQAAIQQQVSKRMLSMFQTIQDRQDTLQQQLLADRAEHWAFMTHILQHTGVQLPPVQSAPPLTLQAAVVPAIQGGPPASSFWSFSLSAPAGHSGFLITRHRTRWCSAASATSACYYHCCCGGVRDCTSSSGSFIAASVRVSTSSSFYYRSWIRD